MIPSLQSDRALPRGSTATLSMVNMQSQRMFITWSLCTIKIVITL